MDNEIHRLVAESRNVTAYLTVASIGSFFCGYYLIAAQNRMLFAFAIALVGFSGSGIAALTSCLDRYAHGFEREDGTKEPKEANGETFNHRMTRWFLVRPFLGLIIAPLFLWGIDLLSRESGTFRDSPQHLVFVAFLGGLLAKSVLDLIKNLFKNVFRT